MTSRDEFLCKGTARDSTGSEGLYIIRGRRINATAQQAKLWCMFGQWEDQGAWEGGLALNNRFIFYNTAGYPYRLGTSLIWYD